MKGIFKEVVNESFNVRSSRDHRKKINKMVISYTGNRDNFEYRKTYEYPVTTTYNQMLTLFPRIIELDK